MKKILQGIIVILALSGCKKGTTITYHVINNSGEQVSIVSYYNYNSRGQEATVINNGDERDIMILSKPDGSFDRNYKACQGIDSITGISSSGKIMVKDLMNPNSWKELTTSRQRLHTFTASLNAKDLQ